MEPIDFLRILRRRWSIVVGTTVVAMALAWFTAPAAPRATNTGPQAGPQARSFTVTHTLVPAGSGPFGSSSSAAPKSSNLDVMALYLKSGEVPKRAAEALGYTNDPADLVGQVETAVDTKAGTISISAAGSDGEGLARLVNTFGGELLAYLNGLQAEEYQRTLDDALARSELLRAQLQGLEDQLSRQPPPGDTVLRSQRDALSRQYSSAFERYQQLNGQGAPPPPLITAQSATPIPVLAKPKTTVPVPGGRDGRTAVAAILGLLLGAGVAIGIDRLDTRLRTKEQFESALDLPVLAEIPRLGRRHRTGLMTVAAPSSPTAEAFRVLRASLPLVGRHVGSRFDPESPPPQVFLVTSAAPGDGKSSVVADLAASFAEAGRTVLTIDCDFWHPRLHTLLSSSLSPGVLDVLGHAAAAPPLAAVVQETSVPGLSMVSAGARPELASELLRQGPQLIDRARRLADIVIIDTGPLLSSSSATELLPAADAVLLVARAGKTSAEGAQRTVQMLARLDAPTLGFVLVGVERPFKGNKYYDRSRALRHPVARPRVGVDSTPEVKADGWPPLVPLQPAHSTNGTGTTVSTTNGTDTNGRIGDGSGGSAGPGSDRPTMPELPDERGIHDRPGRRSETTP